MSTKDKYQVWADKQKKRYLVDYKDTTNSLHTLWKYKIIKRIPILFLIFLIIWIILIFNHNNISPDYLYTYQQFVNLFTNLVAVIGGVYLWSVRTEYLMIIKEILDQLRNLTNLPNLKDLPDIDESEYSTE